MATSPSAPPFGRPGILCKNVKMLKMNRNAARYLFIFVFIWMALIAGICLWAFFRFELESRFLSVGLLATSEWLSGRIWNSEGVDGWAPGAGNSEIWKKVGRWRANIIPIGSEYLSFYWSQVNPSAKPQSQHLRPLYPGAACIIIAIFAKLLNQS